MTTLSSDLVERSLARYPLPIADAVSALDAAESLWERRDRVVEVFRSWLRFVAATAVAARAQFGRGPDGETDTVATLLSALRRRGLTDGQWVSLCRELTRAHRTDPDRHAVPELVRLFHHGKRSPLGVELDGLLEMRKSETVAHGGTGEGDELDAILARRVPQLEKVLEASEALFACVRLVVPLADGGSSDDDQRAWLLSGYTPARGRWRRISLAAGTSVEPGQPVLVDPNGLPVIALHPFAMVKRPTPEAVEECFVLDGGGKRGALYVAFPSMSEHRVRDAWQAIDAMLGGGEEATELTVQGIERPYRGLASFSEKHAAIFFGREGQTEELANRIRRHPMVTVTGPSGSGKSSLLHAGVLPQLGDYRVIKLRPGSQPVSTLGRRLDEFLGQAWLSQQGLEDGTGALLAARPAEIGGVLDTWCRQTSSHVALVVDQAEEIFTLCDDESQREAFAHALVSLGCDAEGPLRVVISLREDFFGRLATLEPLRGLYSRQVEVVTTPDRLALINTLVSPARLFDYQFEDEALVAAMVDPLVGQAAALPLLQFCADQLWERRDRSWKRMTHDALAQLGGVEGALAAHAENVFRDFTSSQEAAARLLMLHLITEDRTRAVVARDVLVASVGSRRDATVVLDRLIDARLLTVREGEGEVAAVEIVHEALISKWDRLSRWLEEDREYHVVRHRVAAAHGRWRDEHKARDFLLGDGKPLAEAEELIAAHPELVPADELEFINASRERVRARRRLVRLAIVGLIGLVVASSGFGYVALKQREQAQESARLAELRQRSVEKSSERIILLQARSALGVDPTATTAWLSQIAVSDDNADEVRSLAREARAQGVASFAIDTKMAAPSRLYIDEDRGEVVVASRERGLAAFSRETGEKTWSHEAGAAQTELAFSENGRFAYLFSNRRPDAAASSPHALVDLKTREFHELVPRDQIAPFPLIAPDGAWMIEIWNDKVSRIDGKTGAATELASGRYHFTALYSETIDKVIAFNEKRIDLVDPSSGGIDPLSTVSLKNPQAGAVIPGKPLAALALSGGDLAFVDLSTGRVEIRQPGFGAYAVMGIEVVAAPDGSRVWVIYSDGRVEAWDTASKKSLGYLRIPNEKVRRLVVSGDSKRVAAATQAGAVHLLDVETGAGPALRSADTHNGPLVFANDGTLYTSTNDGVVRAWPPSEMSSRKLPSLGRDLRYTASGDLIASGKNVIVRWDRSGAEVEKISFAKTVTTVVLSPDGESAVGFSPDALYVWRRGGREPTEVPLSDVERVQFSPDGDQLLVNRGAYGLHRIDLAGLKSGEKPIETTYDIADHEDAAIDRAGNVVIIGDDKDLGDDDDRGMLRYFADGDEDGKRFGAGTATVCAISADGRFIIGGTITGELVTVEPASGVVRDSKLHERAVVAVAITADSKVAVSVGIDRRVFVTTLEDGTSRRLDGETTSLTLAHAFGVGDSLFATGTSGTINLWHLGSGRREEFGGGRMAIARVAVEGDGSQLAALSPEGNIRLWSISAPTEPAQLAAWIASSTRMRIDPSQSIATAPSASE